MEPVSCLSADQLRRWLDGREELAASNLQHIDNCAACQSLIDTITADDTAESLLATPPQTQPDFQHEVELQQVRGQLVAAPDVLRSEAIHEDDATLSTRQSTEAARNEDPDATAFEVDPHATHVPGPAVEDGDATLPAPTFEEELDALTASLPGDRYIVRSRLGRGGAGKVVLAYDKKLARHVAIKILARNSLRDRQRMEREAKLMAEIDHPHVVQIFDVGVLASEEPAIAVPFIVMEHVPGGTVAELIPQQSDKTNTSSARFLDIARLIRDAAFGLDAAHKLGLIHRDVKPANLLLTLQPQTVKVADFGVAKIDAAAGDMTLTGEIVGTPAYMSPEQVGGKKKRRPDAEETITPATDVYSLGATLYTLLTGQRPLLGSTAAILQQILDTDPIAPRVLNPAIPKDLETICQHAMQKEARRRYPSMQAFADDLDRFIAGQPVHARPISGFERSLRWADRNRGLAGSLFAISALILTLAIGGAVTSSILYQQNQEILREREYALQQLCNQVAVSEPEALPLVLQQLQQTDGQVAATLESLLQESAPHEQRRKLNLACSLTSLGREEYVPQVIAGIASAPTSPGQCNVLCVALDTVTDAGKLLEQAGRAAEEPSDQAKLSILALHFGAPQLFEDIATATPDERSSLLHLLKEWHGPLSELTPWLRPPTPKQESQLSPASLRVLLSGLGRIDRRLYSAADLTAIDRACRDWIDAESASPGVISAARWTQAQLGLKTEPAELGFHMLRVPAGQFRMGNLGSEGLFEGRQPHPVRITRDFLLADREVSVGLFRKFCSAKGIEWSPDPVISPTDLHPAQSLTWIQAVQICNWLSQREELQPVYQRKGKIEVGSDDEKTEVELWVRDLEANGFRLPTEAEFAFACRAGTETTYSFGSDSRFFDSYVAWSNNTRIASAPCGTLLPNPWGFFEMHGNVWEWCEDWYQDFESNEEVVDPINLEPHLYGRMYRGGGVCTYTGYPDSAARGGAGHTAAYNNLGLRLARNAPTRDGSTSN